MNKFFVVVVLLGYKEGLNFFVNVVVIVVLGYKGLICEYCCCSSTRI